ncbi:hypothetical protein ASPZODRAFT_20775 [Penicilliopsis zonata CBS 506.65]|uniref:Zn(2)-C6 fungal-type domain-containing protein n=1 Tax=Penicilliopsis zonata CBS 506.65 TaxID=1073090 RepID=A0A1L9S4P4_9EURO|nr:hypothetical protein ASPZODRAFT_20775 [Penicilliopsis zonata CBS 506.65]OJJ42129.1 hypothetical protein ASPZODRAFT_20775 [Penicilliopsis zonata CBS 506.65]
MEPSETQKPKRTSNACSACRQSKIKCSGTDPCANCQRRGIKCHFPDANKVLVDERILQRLLDQAKQQQQQQQQQSDITPKSQTPSTTGKRSADVAFGPMVDIDKSEAYSASTGSHDDHLPVYPHPHHLERSVWANPFPSPSRTVNGLYKGKTGWIWLAPTSLWSMTTRLSLMMAEHLHLESPSRVPSSLDKEVYPLTWRPAAAAASGEEPPDISSLPSLEDALYLFNTVKHHLDQHYRFFDEDAFTMHLHEFYTGHSLHKATQDRLWFVHFLLVLAFGTAFLRRSRNTRDPPGSKFFVRAMSLLPDYTNLWTKGLLAVEVLALAALYLYSIDHRELANIYVVQAIRIAQLDGLHTELPEDELGVKTVNRCQNLWWTLYVMDRHISSSLGLPMTIQDSDITTVLNPAPAGGRSSRRDATFRLHVKLSYLFTSILCSIYKNRRTELGAFLDKTRTILQAMTVYAREIEEIVFPRRGSASVESMPKGTRYITLLYHQCVIVATRPLLLSILKERLERLGQQEDDWQSFLAPTKALISTGIKSAVKTLQILSDEDSLLEIFLPFEMEVTYGAALHLVMANTLFSRATEGAEYIEKAHIILDEMISKGNRLAIARKTELAHLQGLFHELSIQIKHYGLQELFLTTPEQTDHDENGPDMHPHHQSSGQTLDHYSKAQGSPSTAQLPNGVEILDEIGISSYEFLSIIEQIGGTDHSVLDSM